MAEPGYAAGIEVCVNLRGPEAVLRVRGDIDHVSAPELSALLHAVIDRGHQNVILELGDLDFMDAAGLGVLAGAAGRLMVTAGSLTIGSASSMLERMLEITGLSGLLAPDRPIPESLLGTDGTATRQSVHRGPTALGLTGDGLASHVRRVSSIPADNDVVDNALKLVVALARATVGGADGVSVSLRRRGRLSTVAASDETILAMDADQYATGEGPCVDASVKGRWFHVESLRNDPRWPTFAPMAQALGIHAILSSPLLAGENPVGALNIYSRTESAFHPADQRLAAVFATEASTILAEAGVDVTEDELSHRLQSALVTRQMISQAQGMIMAREGVSAEDAYGVLLAHSKSTNQPLGLWAAQVVAGSVPGGRPATGDGRHG